MAHLGVEELKLELERVLKYVNSPRALPEGPGFSLSAIGKLAEEVCRHLEIPTARINTASEPGLSLHLHIHPSAFEMVFWEAMENCKKFHPTGRPNVSLAIRQESDDLVVVELQDDGRRLTPKELENAFHPYFQGEKSFTGQVPGMGLGLSKMRSLLWEVGGDCALSNRCDAEGVTLRMRFRTSPKS
jgi:K+-sensing histidine kinase KdpD